MSRDQDFVIEHINKRLGCHTMTDIIERLRDIQQYAIQLSAEARNAAGQGADEIERLQQLLACDEQRITRIARRALQPKP